MNKIKLLSSILCVSMIVPIFQQINVQATKDRTLEQMIIDEFTIVERDGSTRIVKAETISAQEGDIEISVADKYEIIDNIGGDIVETYATEEEAVEAATLMEEEEVTVQPFNLRAVEYGVVYIRTGTTTEYKMVETGQTGYTHGSYGRDAAYIGTYNGKIRAKFAGVVADFDPNHVDVCNYENNPTSFYREEDGYLYHYYLYSYDKVYSATRVGYDLDYLESDTKYYSYDGHYFYETYPQMIQDYQKGTYEHAINADQPYYNYYQFLSHRSISSYTAEDFDRLSLNVLGSTSYKTSKFYEIGEYFIENQNKYYINALLMYGVAANESNWGKSTIAQNKNNLFGHGAIDSNPYYGSNGYSSVSDSIKYHAYNFLSYGYLDYKDWRYFGPHTGDKESGLNVKYASDPYWGEKAACRTYYLNEVPPEYNQETIGIIKGVLNSVYLYNEPTTSSTKVAKLSQLTNIPVLILDEVMVGDVKWYKIASDTSLNDSRTASNYKLIYRPSQDYLYIQADKVAIVNRYEKIEEPDVTPDTGTETNPDTGTDEGTSNTITIPTLESGHQIKLQDTNFITEAQTTVADIKAIDANAVVKKGETEITDETAMIGTGYTVTINEQTYTIIKRGDASGDGVVNTGDSLTVTLHIVGKKAITDEKLFAACDLNGDGIINTGDSLTLTLHLTNKKIISIQ